MGLLEYGDEEFTISRFSSYCYVCRIYWNYFCSDLRDSFLSRVLMDSLRFIMLKLLLLKIWIYLGASVR
jgi:hypothetical protein